MDSQPEGGLFVPEEPTMNADWKPNFVKLLRAFQQPGSYLEYLTVWAARKQMIAAQLMNDIECLSS